jgi:hypothetical protein
LTPRFTDPRWTTSEPTPKGNQPGRAPTNPR